MISKSKSEIILAVVIALLSVFILSTQTIYAATVLDSDLNSNGILDSTEAEVTVTSNKTLPTGEYNFNNLVITNNAILTLEGDQLSLDPFKGVKINATNITVTSGSRISADGKGYTAGPGAPYSGVNAGAGYGGSGGANTATSTYGSALMPIDLGSGTSGYRGGGAIRLVVTGTLLINGDISSNGGGQRTSGGSIYVTTNYLTGVGTLSANGGSTSWPYYFAGGGGRIAVYYQQSSFTGNVKANAGIYCFYGCNPAGGPGTVVFIDTANNDLYAKGFFRFQPNDAPFNFRNITLENSASAEIEKDVPLTVVNILIKNLSSMVVKNGATVNASSLVLEQNSNFAIIDAPFLNVPFIDVGKGSTLTLSGNETIVADTMNIKNGGTLTVAKEHILSLNIPNLNIELGGAVSANLKGYSTGFGQGVPATPTAGASYGGIGLWNSATSTYGSSTAPTDFGSGGNGYHTQGGGAVRLVVTNMLLNDGTVSADGGNTSSGGSIYVTASKLSGSGKYHANGGGFYWPNVVFGMGGGGRVALYYATSTFTGATTAKGGCNSFDGWSMTCAQNGTVLVKQLETICQTNCYSNILFLPGLMGSRLYQTDSNGTTDQLWEPNTNSDVEELFLSAEGKSLRNDVYTKDVIDEKNVLPIGQGNIYKSFLGEMKTWEDAYGITATTIPYDWRLSLEDIVSNGTIAGEGISYLTATSSPYIIQELRRLAKTSKTGKVTIVAHSNGGLVAKALMQKLGDAETIKLIDKVIFIAVPQTGTPQAIGAILHGYDQGLPFDSLPLILTLETARTLAENMPSAYNLLPSANYFTTVSNPVVTFEDKPIFAEFRSRYGNEIHDGAQLKNFVTDTLRYASSTPSDLIYPSVGNTLLYSNAEVVHGTLDNWAPPQGISVYEIAGWGEDTLATIEYKEGKKSFCKPIAPVFPFTETRCVYTLVPTIIYNPKEVFDGDGTVVTSSALVNTASTTKKYWVDLMKYDEFRYGNVERKHADILEVTDLRTLVQNILTNTSPATLDFISTSIPNTDSIDRLHFVLHSPLDLSARDNFGNTVSSATSTIPGSRFKRYGEVQVLTVPKNIPLTLNLDGYSAGSFTLDIEEINSSNIVTSSSTFSGVPSSTNTRASMVFTDGTIQNASPLIVDYDGNGITDFTITTKPGEIVVFDTTPPEAHISFSTTTGKLLIQGIDEGGMTTVLNTATSSLLTDLTGSTLGIIFSKFNIEKKEIKMQMQGLYYNGVSTSTIPKTTLQYEWSTDNDGNIKELEQKIAVGNFKIEAYYNAKRNNTSIKKKITKEENIEIESDNTNKEIKEMLPGLVIIGIKTDKGSVYIDY